MSRTKNILIILLSVVGLLFLFGVWYQYTYSMDKAEAFQVNFSQYPKKLLVATQGSEFKNSVTHQIVDHFKTDSVYINVVDISALEAIKLKNYNAILIIHTWENWKPPEVVKAFINSNITYKDQMVVITTSGEGTSKMDDIDAITGESKPENIEPMATKAIRELEIILD